MLSLFELRHRDDGEKIALTFSLPFFSSFNSRIESSTSPEAWRRAICVL